MHLLTLLIAAVFSSQFVEPNALTTMTLSPAAATVAELKAALPEIGITLNEAPAAGDLIWTLALNEGGTSAAIVVTTLVEKDTDTTYTFTHVAGTALDDLYALGIPAKIYLHLKDSEDTEVSAAITITPAFTVTPASLFESKLTKETTITLTAVAWADAPSIIWAASSASQLLADGITNAAVGGNVAAVSGDVALSFAASNFTDLGELTDKAIYFYAGVATAAAAADNPPVAVPVVPDFTVTPKKVFDFETTIPALTVTMATGAWEVAHQVKVRLCNDTGASGEIIKESEALTEASGVYTMEDIAFDATDFGEGKIFVYVAVSPDGDDWDDVRGPVEIPIEAEEFKLDDYTLKDSATTLSATIEVVDDIASLAETDQLKFFITKEPVENPEEELNPATGVVAAKDTGKLYKIVSATIPGVPPARLTEDDTLYIYACYQEKEEQGGQYVFYKHGRSISIVEDTEQARFTVSPTTIPAGPVADGKTITITQKYGKTWTGIKVKFNVQGTTAPTPVMANPITGTGDVFVLTLTAEMKALVAPLAKDAVIEVTVEPTGKTGYYEEPARITISAGRLCGVSPPTVTHAEWTAKHTFEVTLDASVTWTKDTSKLVISRAATVAELGAATDIVLEGLEATDDEISFTLTDAQLTKFTTVTPPLPVYVYVSSLATPVDDQTPASFVIEADPLPLQFAVEPKTIVDGATVIEDLTIVPINSGGWTNTIDYMVIDCPIEEKTQSSKFVEGKADKDTGGDKDVWIAKTDVELTDFTVIAGKTLYVYCNRVENAPLDDTPDIITVSPAETPSFTINPTGMDWAATLTTPVITVTPNAAAEFPATAGGEFKAIFTYSDKDDIPVAIAVADGSEAGTKVYTIPATDISAFEIAGDVAKDVVVKINNGEEVLEHTVNFNIRKKETPGGAAMGVSPLLSLLAALVFLFVKLF